MYICNARGCTCILLLNRGRYTLWPIHLCNVCVCVCACVRVCVYTSIIYIFNVCGCTCILLLNRGPYTLWPSSWPPAATVTRQLCLHAGRYVSSSSWHRCVLLLICRSHDSCVCMRGRCVHMYTYNIYIYIYIICTHNTHTHTHIQVFSWGRGSHGQVHTVSVVKNECQ